MTVKELIKELKQYDANLIVTRVVDFDNIDEFGNSESEEISGTIRQTFIDVQFVAEDFHEVMIY